MQFGKVVLCRLIGKCYAKESAYIRVLPIPVVIGAGLTRAILAEMLGLSASALGSVQVALTGTSDSGTEQPAGWEAAPVSMLISVDTHALGT